MKWQKMGVIARVFTCGVMFILLAACTAPDIPNTPTSVPAAPTHQPDASAVEPTAVITAAPPVTAQTDPPAVSEVAPEQAVTPSVYMPVAASVAALPDPAGFTWVQVASGLAKPLDVQSPPDGTGRLFIVEQAGVIKIVQNGALLPDVFLDIRSRVGSDGSERGLLGLAFHPQFAQNHFFYLYYTDKQGDTVVSRFTAPQAGSQADAASEKPLLTQDQPFANHNGGGMRFGPDGYLYISLGDGGSAADPQGNGQNLDTWLGKILRVDVNGGSTDAPALQIPADNPFATGGARPEIWAYGLRNAWRFSFDLATGDVYIADVGQNAWEEVNFQAAGSAGGQNYGWNYREGMHEFRGTPPQGSNLTDPVWEYGHDQGCSVTGGVVYRGTAIPEFNGVYLAADYCSGYIWGLLRGADGGWQSQKLFETGLSITGFGEDAQGEVFLVEQGEGGLYRLARKP